MLRTIIISMGVLLIGWSTMPSAAQAQMVCDDRGTVVSTLDKGYSEKPVSMGLSSNGAVVEVFVSETGTFTIIMTRPSGLSCLVAAGENWEDLPERLVGAKI